MIPLNPSSADILRAARELTDDKTRKLALKALKLSRAGEKGKAIGLALKVDTGRAIQLACIGNEILHIEGASLTASEVLLLRSLARMHRSRVRNGVTSSPKSEDVSWLARKSDSWAASTARKRLGCPGRRTDPKAALSLIDVAGNGYMNLTVLGWMFVNAIETAEIALAEQAVQS